MSKKSTSLSCPCGSGKLQANCCGPYIAGEQIPPTAEALMRSRYTAYTQANIDYIQATMREQAAENFDPLAARDWSVTAKWKRLKVIRTFADPITGIAYVEFMAFYIFAGTLRKLVETSAFRLIDQKWYYIGVFDPGARSGSPAV